MQTLHPILNISTKLILVKKKIAYLIRILDTVVETINCIKRHYKCLSSLIKMYTNSFSSQLTQQSTKFDGVMRLEDFGVKYVLVDFSIPSLKQRFAISKNISETFRKRSWKRY